MTQTETQFCVTVEKVMHNDMDAVDDLDFDAYELMRENPNKFKTCHTYISMYQKIKEEENEK